MTPAEVERIADEVADEANRELEAHGGNANVLPSIFDRLIARRYLSSEDAPRVRREATSRAALKRSRGRAGRL